MLEKIKFWKKKILQTPGQIENVKGEIPIISPSSWTETEDGQRETFPESRDISKDASC